MIENKYRVRQLFLENIKVKLVTAVSQPFLFIFFSNFDVFSLMTYCSHYSVKSNSASTGLWAPSEILGRPLGYTFRGRALF
jgi:hypothetical protein